MASWRTYAYVSGKTCCDCGIGVLDTSTRCKSCSLTERNKRVVRTGAEHPRWKGGRRIDKDGYVLIGKRKEHVLIAERTLGRKLRHRIEIVHHINGVKSDNRRCNLLICTQSYHQYLHHKMSGLYQKEHFGGTHGV